MHKLLITSSLVRATGIATSFLLSIIISRHYGSEILGQYSVFIATITILSVFCKMGTETALIKLVANIATKNNTPSMLGGSITTAILAGIILSIATVMTDLTPVSLRSRAIDIAVFSLTVIFFSINGILSSIIFGMKKSTEGTAVQFTLDKVLLLILITLTLALISENHFSSLIQLYFLSILITCSTALLFLIKSFGKEIILLRPLKHFNFSERKHYLLQNASSVIMNNLDVIVISIIIDNLTAAFYAVALRISMLSVIFLSVANSILSPHIHKLFIENNIFKLGNLLSKSALLTTIPSILAALVFYFFGNEILKLWGKEYTEAYITLLLLALIQVVNSLFGSVGLALTMANQHKKVSQIMLILSPVHVITSIVFTHEYGSQGTAISYGIAMLTMNILCAISLKKAMNININPIYFLNRSRLR